MKLTEAWFRQFGKLELKKYPSGIVYELETIHFVFRGYGIPGAFGESKALQSLYGEINTALRRTCELLDMRKESNKHASN